MTKRYNEESWQAQGGTRQTPGYLQKKPCHLPEETDVQLLCAASYNIWCRDLDTDQTNTVQMCGHTERNGIKYAQHHIQGQKDQHLGTERTKVIDIISNMRKIKWSWAGQGTSTASKTADGPRLSQFETI